MNERTSEPRKTGKYIRQLQLPKDLYGFPHEKLYTKFLAFSMEMCDSIELLIISKKSPK